MRRNLARVQGGIYHGHTQPHTKAHTHTHKAHTQCTHTTHTYKAPTHTRTNTFAAIVLHASPLERRHPRLERVVGRVHDARVDVPELAQPEEVRAVRRVVEREGGGGVDGKRPGTAAADAAPAPTRVGDRLGLVALVELKQVRRAADEWSRHSKQQVVRGECEVELMTRVRAKRVWREWPNERALPGECVVRDGGRGEA